MTLGENIRYQRKLLGLTQAKLAELSGIHPVSIRKYETNKAKPQHEQVLKIAKALDIEYNFLYEPKKINETTTSDTATDVVLKLFKLGLLKITGEYDKKNLIKKENCVVSFAPEFENFFQLSLNDNQLDLENIQILISKDEILEEILNYDRILYIEKMYKDFTNRDFTFMKDAFPECDDNFIHLMKNISFQNFGKMFYPEVFIDTN